jgi:hypothetical protein
MLFLESPWPILIFGLAIELFLAIALFRTGRALLLWAIAGVALVVLLGVLVERATITDTKRIRQTLEEAAAGLVANNESQVKACIVEGPDGNAALGKTKSALALAVFREISIRNLEVTFNYQTSPPTAETKFTVFARGKARAGDYMDAGEITKPANMEVKLRKHSGRWLVYGEVKCDALP